MHNLSQIALGWFRSEQYLEQSTMYICWQTVHMEGYVPFSYYCNWPSRKYVYFKCTGIRMSYKCANKYVLRNEHYWRLIRLRSWKYGKWLQFWKCPCIQRYLDLAYLPLLSVPYVYKFTGKPLLMCNMSQQVGSTQLGRIIIILQWILNDVVSLRRKMESKGVQQSCHLHSHYAHHFHK